jgi:sugar phosphate isomerase/epimerase
MRLSISNIAWDPADDDEVLDLLQEMGVACIDVAPSKLFASVADATVDEADRLRRGYQQRGIAIAGMQSLFYGTSGLNIFGPPALQQRTLQHLGHVFRLAEALGCPALTLGSPKQRDPQGREAARAWQEGRDFFRRAADLAEAANVCLCLEPNPKAYGCHFLTHTEEAAAMVADVDAKGVRLQLDLGTCSVNDEDLAALLRAHADKVGHVHLSEPHLAPLSVANDRHRSYAQALVRELPEATYTVEMLTPKGAERMPLLRAALSAAKTLYGTERKVPPARAPRGPAEESSSWQA